jgi:hypothetical protein
MQENFRGIDASIAGHVSNASRLIRCQQRPIRSRLRFDGDDKSHNNMDIHTNSSFWSDNDEQYSQPLVHRHNYQRPIARYLSTVNRSLLDCPSHLIADYYIAQLNHNMQASVRRIETIARDRHDHHAVPYRFERSLSAEHLYQVRKEHVRYRQAWTRPTSFTVEDVADIYKPFALESYKRKIAIELERRRRERHSAMLTDKGNARVQLHVSGCDRSSFRYAKFVCIDM